jgi:hypothetical protein
LDEQKRQIIPLPIPVLCLLAPHNFAPIVVDIVFAESIAIKTLALLCVENVFEAGNL